MRALIILLILAVSEAAHAADSPEQAVREYFLALPEKGAAALAPVLHPAEQERFKEMMIPVVRQAVAGGQANTLPEFFGPGATMESVEKMPAATFTTNYLTNLQRLYQVQRVDITSLEILGTVREGEIVHVVLRYGFAAANGVKKKLMQVVSTKPLGKEWKLMLTGELEGMASAASR